MKKGILFLLLACSVLANAQSLKETLYGGKLKNEPGTVIRKGDDLSTKIDTTHKTVIRDTAIANKPMLKSDSSAKKLTLQTDPAALGADVNITKENTSPKDNNVIWKEYITAVTNTLKTEVLPSKKIKSGTYYISLSYAIDTGGELAINNVLVTPENSFLQQQIKDRISLDVPRMNPVLSSTGTPRKMSKNYNFTLVKE